MEHEPRTERHSTSKTDDNVERLRSLVRSDRRLTLRIISSELNLNRFTVHQILTQDLNMRNVCAQDVSKNKTPKSGVAHCKLFPSQERENEQIQNLVHAHLFLFLFFFFLTLRGSSKRNLCHQDKLSIKFDREVLERRRKRVARVRPGIERTWMLHHNNAPCHTAVSINECLAEKTLLWFLSHHIRRISVPVTSFYSPGSKTT